MKVRHAIYGLIGCMAALQVNEALAYDPVMMQMGLQLLNSSQPGYTTYSAPYPGYYQQQQFQQTELLKEIEHTQRQMYYDQADYNARRLLRDMQ